MNPKSDGSSAQKSMTTGKIVPQKTGFGKIHVLGLCLGASSGVNVAGAIRLAKEMGPDAFSNFVQAYYRQYRWEIATGDDFKRLAEESCACDLTPLFETWVYPKN